jgi:predicted adenylyl cyclase CyaB
MGTSSNIEIKARCRDLAAARSAAQRVATRYVGIDQQIDTYFRTSEGRLKLRESSLEGGQLVPYLRLDTPGPKRSDYRVVPIEDAAGLKALMARILGVHRVVRKQREIFLHHNVRIHLDRVEGLGEFVEFEAVFDGAPSAEAEQRSVVDFLMEEFGMESADLLAGSYEAMVDP